MADIHTRLAPDSALFLDVMCPHGVARTWHIVFMQNTRTRHITARLPEPLVEKLDLTAQRQNRTRTGQLVHELQRVYADSQPTRQHKEPRNAD